MKGMNITQKLISSHLVSGDMKPGGEIAIRIDQTLTQDSTGTMAYLQFEAMGIDKVKTKRSVAYIDHNMLQAGSENADDHKYIQTVAAKHGIWFSRPGNGICHQVQLERFSVPGPDAARLRQPHAHLRRGGHARHRRRRTGRGGGHGRRGVLPHHAQGLPRGAHGRAAADGVGEGHYSRGSAPPERQGRRGQGHGVRRAGRGDAERARARHHRQYGRGAGRHHLGVPQRRRTVEFFAARGRRGDWAPLAADADAEYDEEITIDLSALHPLAAQPHRPDNVAPMCEMAGIKVDQVCIGSCTNSSFCDMMRVAGILEARTWRPTSA